MSNIDSELVEQFKKVTSMLDGIKNSNVDLVVDHNKTLFIDGLNSAVSAVKTDGGFNEYKIANQLFEQTIGFQSGAPTNEEGENLVNGCSNESVLAVVLHRLKKQNELVPSPFNDMAIALLGAVISLLQARLITRQDFGIYRTMESLPENVDEAKLMNSLSIITSIGYVLDVIIRYNVHNNIKDAATLDSHLRQLLPGSTDGNSILDAFILTAVGYKGTGIDQGISSIAHKTVSALNSKTETEAGQVTEEGGQDA